MTRTDPLTAIGPQAYVSWRAASLGAITEALEQRQVAADWCYQRERANLTDGVP